MENDYTNMVYKLASSFQASTGMEFEDLLGEGFLYWQEALYAFEEKKGLQFSTLLYTVLKNRYLQIAKENNKNAADLVPTEMLTSLQSRKKWEANTPETLAIFKNSIENLSTEAQYVVKSIFEVHKDIFKTGRETAAKIKGNIRKHLISIGWTHERMNDTLRELKQSMKTKKEEL